MAKWVLLVLLAAALLVPASASATLCGQKDPKTRHTAIGQLTLDAASRTDLVYKRSTASRALLLVFDVKGCTMNRYQSIPAPRVTVTASNGPNQDLPDEAIRLSGASFIDANEIEYRLDVDTGKLPPGSYNGAIEVRADYFRTARTPVSVSRSENDLLIPFAFGALGGLAGILWYVTVAAFSSALPSDRKLWAAIVLGVGVIAGAIAGLGFWLNQDVWTVGDNAWPTVIAGFTGATTGAVAALTTHLVKRHSADAKRAAEPAPKDAAGLRFTDDESAA